MARLHKTIRENIKHSGREHSNSTTFATAYGSDGSYAHSTASTQTDSTYTTNEYIPWSESHPYYSTSYTVSFLLFDKDGNALITPKTKKITLHIFTETGEQVVEYDLSKRAKVEKKRK